METAQHPGIRSIQSAVESCTTELLLVQVTAVVAGWLRPGTRVRSLHHETAPPPWASAPSGAQVRLSRVELTPMIICDRRTAYLLPSDASGPPATAIADPAVVWFLAGVFEQLWRRAARLADDEDGLDEMLHDDVAGAVVRMLIAGDTDARIARELGISVRTVGNHVSRLSRALQARSRAQLGFLLGTSGRLAGPQ